MKIYVTLIIIIAIIALVATILLGGKSDSNYDKATSKNLTTLTLIYVVTIIGALIALGIFIL